MEQEWADQVEALGDYDCDVACGMSWLGPVPEVGVMAKGPQGWVKCEDRLPYYRGSSCGLPRLHGHGP
jgi:hypothetical protein